MNGVTLKSLLPRRLSFHSKTLLTSIALLLAISVYIILYPKDQNLVWLNPNQAGANPPGPLLRLRSKLSGWAGPLVQRFRKAKRQISIDTELVAPSPATQLGLNSATATNSDGTRVWILSPDQLNALRYRRSRISDAQLQTTERMRARLFVGGTPPSGTNYGSPTCTLDILPKITRGSITLVVGASCTYYLPAPRNAIREVRTNIAVACRAAVPNGGAMVLASAKTNEVDGRFLWIIVSPSVVDKRGRLQEL